VATLALTVGCSQPSSSGGEANAPANSADVRALQASASATALPVSDESWVVSIRGIHGDCAPDTDSCDKRYEARSDGAWLSHFEPHPLARNGRPINAQKQLPGATLEALQRLVRSAKFDQEMTDGFACQGGKNGHDYSWRITLKSASGERSQRVEYCISGPAENVNSARELLRLLSE
jgi:hypothetical protein